MVLDVLDLSVLLSNPLLHPSGTSIDLLLLKTGINDIYTRPYLRICVISIPHTHPHP